MEPKWCQMGAQNVPKNEVSQKSAKCGLDLLFTIYSHYWHPPKTSLFVTSQQPNTHLFRGVPRMPPRGCKMAPTGPENGGSGVPRDPQGCQRVSQCFPKRSKKHPKSALLLPGCLGYPTAPKNTSIFDVPPTGVTPSRGNVRTFPSHSLLHPTYFLLR